MTFVYRTFPLPCSIFDSEPEPEVEGIAVNAGGEGDEDKAVAAQEETVADPKEEFGSALDFHPNLSAILPFRLGFFWIRFAEEIWQWEEEEVEEEEEEAGIEE
mmetsp:Transcript_31718/g.57635  ORF Transcript_31718/g.57635 Transcript_31718/m.57635 type:complete len:103 (+) Transcript_31718:805-1113(+)